MNLLSKENRILLRELVKTDFKLRYQGSAVGHLWSLLKPLMLFGVMYIVFIHFLKFGQDIPHFAVALLLGMVIWTFFQETTTMGLTAVVSRGDLLRKLAFPNEILIFSVSINAFINFLINLAVVLFFALLNGVSVSKYALLAPFLLVELYMFSLGVAFILGTIFVKYRDIAPVWEVFMQAGLYATPILYPLSLVTQTSVLAGKLVMLNPMAQIIQDMRFICISDQNTPVHQVVGSSLVWIPYVLPAVILVVGYKYFKTNSRRFAEII